VLIEPESFGLRLAAMLGGKTAFDDEKDPDFEDRQE